MVDQGIKRGTRHPQGLVIALSALGMSQPSYLVNPSRLSHLVSLSRRAPPVIVVHHHHPSFVIVPPCAPSSSFVRRAATPSPSFIRRGAESLPSLRRTSCAAQPSRRAAARHDRCFWLRLKCVLPSRCPLKTTPTGRPARGLSL